MRAFRLIAVISAIAALPATPAGAATIGSSFEGSLSITAAGGEVNSMTIEVHADLNGGSTVIARDTGTPLVAGSGCDLPAMDGEVTCTIPGLYVVFVALDDRDDTLTADNRDPGVQLTVGAGDGADSVEVGPRGDVCLDGGLGADHLAISTPSRACTVDGGEGEDLLTGSRGYDRLHGGPDTDVVLGGAGDDYVYGDDGNDTVGGGAGDEVVVEGGAGDDDLDGNTGEDHLDDGPGDDELLGGAGADKFGSTFFFDSGDDVYTGGLGRDRLVYFCPACRISLDGVANDGRPAVGEADDVDVEGLSIPSRTPPDPDDGDPGQSYGTGADALTGDAAANVLISQRGDDRLNGRAGADWLRAGQGDDVIRADDGIADPVVNCGPGTDTAFVDPLDTPDGCEQIRSPAYSQPRRRK